MTPGRGRLLTKIKLPLITAAAIQGPMPSPM